MAKKKESPFRLIVILTVLVVALVVVLVVATNDNNTESKIGTNLEEQPPIEGQPTLGNEDAPVTVVEFGDFKCPSCKAWGEMVFPQLVRDYVDTGKVKLAYINVLFHGEESTYGSLAAETVYEQNPDAYWDFHKAIYEEQPQSHDLFWITEEKIVEIANEVDGIDTDALMTEMENITQMDEVNKDNALVTEFGVQQTPTIMVDNVMLEDPFDYEAIKNAIDEALEGK